MKKVKNFTDPVDKASAARCTQQVSEFEDNTEAETAAIRDGFQQNLQPIALAAKDSKVIIGAGESCGFDTSTQSLTCLLRKPTPADAGRFVAVWKPYAANALTLQAAAETFVNRSSSFVLPAIGLTVLFCDGVEYWTDV